MSRFIFGEGSETAINIEDVKRTYKHNDINSTFIPFPPEITLQIKNVGVFDLNTQELAKMLQSENKSLRQMVIEALTDKINNAPNKINIIKNVRNINLITDNYISEYRNEAYNAFMKTSTVYKSLEEYLATDYCNIQQLQKNIGMDKTEYLLKHDYLINDVKTLKIENFSRDSLIKNVVDTIRQLYNEHNYPKDVGELLIELSNGISPESFFEKINNEGTEFLNDYLETLSDKKINSVLECIDHIDFRKAINEKTEEFEYAIN